MEEKTQNWPRRCVRALGILFALLALPDLVYWISIVVHKEKLRTTIAQVGPGYVTLELYGTHGAGTVAGLLLGFALLVSTGVGLWKLKFWGRSLAEALAVLVVLATYREIWFYGPQVHGWLYYVLWLLFVGVTFSLLSGSTVRQLFPVPRRARSLTRRKELLYLMIPVLTGFLAFPAFVAYLRVKHRGQIVRITSRPKRVEYEVMDSSFLADSCNEYDVFGYSIHLPKGLVVMTAGKYSGTLGWWLALTRTDNIPLDLVVMLNDRSPLEQHLADERKVLGFSSPFEFEETVVYPTWSPLYFYMKPFYVWSADTVEHATSNEWKGFVAITHLEDKHRWMIEASLYEVDNASSGHITLNFKDGQMSLDQARELLASVRFRIDTMPHSELFKRGKKALLNGEYTSSTSSFLTALHNDSLNAEYAYYLARSLFEDRRVPRRKMRLRSSAELLNYALKLNPEYFQAEELLALVNGEHEGLR